MVEAFRWSSQPAQGALELKKWLALNGAAKEHNPAEIRELRELGATVALEGGDPSSALDFTLQNIAARLPEDAIPQVEIERLLSLSTQSSRLADVVPWLARYTKSLPEDTLDWKKLPDLAAKSPAQVAAYAKWVRLLAQYSDWTSHFDAAFDAHFRLAALGENPALDRCLELCDFLGRSEEMADLLQYSDVGSKRPELQSKLANLLAALGRDTEALPLYQKWTTAHPEDVEAAHDMACLLEDMGLEGDALTAFEQAVAQAEAEFKQEVGADVATVVSLGLEAYAEGDTSLESHP
jgi:tetratricopeptide (TPR) repeat protein